jgi:predicted nucleic acid-binding protein
MSGDRVFVDTNVLVYAYDADAADKHEVAQRRLAELWNDETGAVSVQILQEFYVAATRKLPRPITKRVAREVIDTYDTWSPHRPTTADLIAASELEERHRLAFWDALVIIAAQRCECATLLSEDLQSGQRFGPVTVVNPFDENPGTPR